MAKANFIFIEEYIWLFPTSSVKTTVVKLLREPLEHMDI